MKQINMTGIWLGQNIGDLPSAIHVWIIVDLGKRLLIHTHWLGFDYGSGYYEASFLSRKTSHAFIIGTNKPITIYDDNTFVVSKWSLAEVDEDNPTKQKFYDVVFQRRDHGWVRQLIALYIRLFQNSPAMLRQLSR